MRGVQATRQGGPEVLEVRHDLPPPAADGRVLIEVHRAGVNFADLLSTQGRYAQAPAFPFVPGLEVSGHDRATGRPVMAIVPGGGYADLVAADPRLTWEVAEGDLDQAAGWPLVGMTAWHGLAEVARLRPGERVLVSAAAGGVGTAAIQVARALGAGRIVGLASTPEKQAAARAAGADESRGYGDLEERFDVFVDTVGGIVFEQGLAALDFFGRAVLIGSSSGQAPVIPPVGETRVRGVGTHAFSLGAYRADHPDRFARTAAGALELIREGRLRPPVREVFALADAAEAHRRLGSRATTGKLLLAVGG